MSMMSRLIALAPLIFLLSGSALGQPRLLAPVSRFDFGVVPTGTVLSHHFWLKSVGEDTVTIDEIKTGCSCAISEFDKKVLPPGDSVLVGFQWDITRSRGSLMRSPMIFYNGSDQALRVYMEGTVWEYPDSARPVFAKPHRFELSRASVKDVTKLNYRLMNQSDKNLAVSLLSVVPRQVELTVPDSVPAGGSAAGYVQIKPEYRDEEFSTSVTLLIGGDRPERLTIPIRRKFY